MNAKPQGRRKVYTLKDTIPAGVTGYQISKDMDGSIEFESREIRGSFTTLATVGGNIVDNAVECLKMKIIEGGTDYQFFDSPVTAGVILAPGRKKSPLATNNATNNAVNGVYQPLSFFHKFTKKIIVEVSNTSNTDQEFEISFIGYETQRVM